MILGSNRKTEYHISYDQYADVAIRYGANLLQKYLYKATEILFPLFSSRCPRRSKEIIIGNNCREIEEQEEVLELLSGLSSEGFIIKVLKNLDILIVGNSNRASFYGIIYFLEKTIDLKCFHKSEITFKTLNTVSLENNLYLKDFTFEYREVYFTDSFDSTFASFNYLNSNLAYLGDEVGSKMKWYNFHHSFSDLVSVDEYFTTHPEYFSYVDGKRIKEHTQLCLSNEDVFLISLNKIKTWLKIGNYDVISVSQDEWLGHFDNFCCRCSKCMEIDNFHESHSGSIIRFVNRIASSLEKEYPNLLIHTFAYQYSRKPPKNIKIHKNVIVRLCNIECSWDKPIEEGLEGSSNYHFIQDLIGWSKLTSRLYIWDYCVNYRNYLLPFPNLRSMYKNILFYKKHNVKGLLMQGNFSNGGKGYLDELKSYIIARLCCDDESSLEEFVKDFCLNYYKDCCDIVYELIMLFEDSVKGYKLWLYDDANNPMFSNDLIQKANTLNNQLIKALEKTNNLVIKDRILALTLSVRYLTIVCLPLEDPSRNNLIIEFENDVRKLGITELFERCNLDYSFDVIKTSLYAKNRDKFYSLYYVMK